MEQQMAMKAAKRRAPDRARNWGNANVEETAPEGATATHHDEIIIAYLIDE